MSEEKVAKYTVRLPMQLYRQLQAKATEQGCSINSALFFGARDWVNNGKIDPPKPTLGEMIVEHLSEMEKRLMAMLDPQGLRHVTSLKISGDFTDLEERALDLLKRSEPGRLYPGTKMELQHLTVPGALEWEGSPTGRLGNTEPEIQSLPVAVDTMHPQPLKGQTWVISGGLESMHRDTARDHLMGLGAVVAGAVGRKTDALIVGTGATPTKIDAADVYGVPTWSERQFLHLLKGCGRDVEIPQ